MLGKVVPVLWTSTGRLARISRNVLEKLLPGALLRSKRTMRQVIRLRHTLLRKAPQETERLPVAERVLSDTRAIVEVRNEAIKMKFRSRANAK
jgi:hypothetical protein